ncbi:Down syndrome cell adhesion molecule-like protein 1 [Chamberlinius hualienensis]
MTSTGELYIFNIHPSDNACKYRCRTKHRLTGEEKLSAASPSGRLYVTEPSGSVTPRTTDTKASVSVKQGDSVTLPCAAQGYPVPNYSWYKKVSEGVYVPVALNEKVSQLSGVLIVSHVQTDDAGVYSCEAFNSIGSVRVETQLIVTASLSALVYPQKQTVNLGESATLNCVVSGFPVMHMSWVKDGKILTHDSINHLTKDVLRISSVQKEDRGMYQCFVSNDQEVAQGTAEIRLGDTPPEFRKIFSNRTIHPDTSVSLQCVVSGNPTPELHWTLDDENLPDGPRFSRTEFMDAKGDVVSHINISSTQVEDGGEYACQASNRAGQIKHKARINVFGDPYIRLPPQISVVANKNLTVRCHVGGYPIPLVTWERDGKVLPTNHRQRILSDGSLIIENVQRSYDSGQYTCIARNNNGRSTRQDLQVIVLVPPEIMPFPDIQPNEGSRAQITCAVTQGDPPIRIEWSKDGEQPIPSSLSVVERTFDQYSSSLSIDNIQSLHSGNYTCHVTNSAAIVLYTVQLSVNVPPRWLISPRDSHVLLGGSAIMHCKADGFPLPSITWMKALGSTPSEYREVSIPNAHLRQHENGSLEVVSARQSDGGYYLCKANNGIGAGLSQVVQLHVHVPAHFPTKHRSVGSQVGESASLLCEAMGDKPISISWQFDSRLIGSEINSRYQVKEEVWENGITSRLVIIISEKQDDGTYTCIARNEFGEDKSVIHFTVQEYPSAPVNPKISQRNSRTVEIQWTEPHDGNSRMIHFVIQYKISTGDWNSDAKNVTVLAGDNHHVIANLQPATHYNFRIFAVNEVGIGPSSDVVDVVTDMEAPGGTPEDVQVDAVDSTTLKVTWKPPKRHLWFGGLTGYNIGYRIYESIDSVSYKTVKAPGFSDGASSEDEELQMAIHDLKKFTKYGVIVQAFNHLGSGPKSDEVVARTLEDAPSKSPENIRCSPLTSQSLLVQWEPPPQLSFNGVLQGYKVLYARTKDWYENMEMDVKITSAWKLMLHGLDKFENYTIQTQAFTRMGDSSRSRPIFCRTLEDVPEPPPDIKALTVSSDAIIIVWKPPQTTNGHLVKFTLYSRSADSDHKDMTKHIMMPDTFSYEIRHLREDVRYEFWLTASTAIGEGQSTKVVSQVPGSNVPAKIVGFDGSIVAKWRDTVSLPCRSLGNPFPDKEWSFGDESLTKNDRIFWDTSEGALHISNVKSSDAGTYCCRVINIHGEDKLVYQLSVQAPPGPPTFQVVATTTSALHIRWTPQSELKNHIQDYVLHYKRDFGEWEKSVFSTTSENTILEHLWCGTRYQLFATARNWIGEGEASDVIISRTKGAAPEHPPKEKCIKENSTFITLNLAAWGDGGCRILYFVIEYKPRSQADWMLVSNNVNTQKEQYPILDLQPDMWYNLKVTAHNSAGSTVAHYEFVTSPQLGGGTASIDSGFETKDTESESGISLDINIVFPFIALLVVSVTAVIAIYCFRKRFAQRHIVQNREEGKQFEAHFVKGGTGAGGQGGGMASSRADLDKGSFACLINSDSANPCSSKTIHKKGKGEVLQPYATYRLPTDLKTTNFTDGDWNKFEIYTSGPSTGGHTVHPQGHSGQSESSRAVGSGSGSSNIYPMLQPEEEPLQGPCPGPDSSLSDDQEYASPVRSSETSDSNSGSCAVMSDKHHPDPSITQLHPGQMKVSSSQIDKLRKPGRRAKVPDLIYRRQADCYARPLTPPGEEALTLTSIKIPRPQLEIPSAPLAETTIDSTFSFLDQMGSSQESSDTAKNEDSVDKTDSRGSSTT